MRKEISDLRNANSMGGLDNDNLLKMLGTLLERVEALEASDKGSSTDKVEVKLELHSVRVKVTSSNAAFILLLKEAAEGSNSPKVHCSQISSSQDPQEYWVWVSIESSNKADVLEFYREIRSTLDNALAELGGNIPHDVHFSYKLR